MSKVHGKLTEDVRINHEGKEDGAGRLYLRGEFVSVDESIKHKVDTSAKPAPRRRMAFNDKQAAPRDDRTVTSLKREVATLSKQVEELTKKLKEKETDK